MNLDSKTEDATIAVLIWRHYQNIGVKDGWNRDRFNRLCQLAKCVPEEIGALCAVRPADIRKMMSRNNFTPTVSLHLAIFEAVLLEAQCGRKWEPVVPMHLIQK